MTEIDEFASELDEVLNKYGYSLEELDIEEEYLELIAIKEVR